jgi:hypothetical protein
MPAAMPRHQALRQLAADSTARAALAAQAGPAPDDVSAWLADLQALVGVPFAYLVPDSRMLPPESIRFFAVDPNWTAALVDGALSIAATTAPAAAASEALRPGALTAARQAAASRLRAPAAPQPAAPAPRPAAAAPRPAAAADEPATPTDEPATPTDEPATPTDEPATPTDEPGAADEPAAAADESAAGVTPTYSGFLLRSAAVADWPGMQVNGYADPQAATPALPIVRLERLAPTILLALFAGMIQRVDLTEPGQHLSFGVVPLSGGLSVQLRSVEPATAGAQLAGDPTVTVRCRPDPNRTVLDVTATVAAVEQGLGVSSLSPSGLGLQLLQPPPSQTFTTAAVATAPAQADPSQATP